jgi:hypothetical protein
MIEIAINNPPVENYFKTPESINSFLENAFQLDLLSMVDEIKNDQLHQKSLNDIKGNNLAFYTDSKSLIKALND